MGFAEVFTLLGTAGKAISAVGSIGKFAYDVFKWAQGPEPTNTDIFKKIQDMQKDLRGLQDSLSAIQAQLATGFDEILKQIGQLAFNEQVRPLKNLAGTVAATEDDFQDVVNNATADHFSEVLVKYKLDAINRNITDVEREFQLANDLFRDAFFKSTVGVGTTPAYFYAGQTLLAGTEHFMTPDDSKRLREFASFVLQYQALAFNLIVRWETYLSPEAPDRTLSHAIKVYLGFDTAAQAANWIDHESAGEYPRSLLDAGDLRDELDLLDSIKEVPEHTIVEADGLENAPGLMWQSKGAKDILLGRTIGDAPRPDGTPATGKGCANLGEGPHFVTGLKWANNPYSGINSLSDPNRFDWCQYMQEGWSVAQGDLKAADTGLPLAGWSPATLTQTQALLTRVKAIASDRLPSIIGPNRVIDIKADYWDPDPEHTSLRVSKYALNTGGGYSDTYTGYYYQWVDRADVTTVRGLSGATPLSPSEIASMGTKGSCFFGVGESAKPPAPRANCPVLHTLVLRKPDSSELYWPQG